MDHAIKCTNMGPLCISLTITGQPITKKNHATIKCVAGRPIYITPAAYRRYEKMALESIMAHSALRNLPCPITVTAHYYLANHRKPDLINLMQATADILEKSRLILNDRQIISWNGTKIAGIDKSSPRTEITILTNCQNCDFKK